MERREGRSFFLWGPWLEPRTLRPLGEHCRSAASSPQQRAASIQLPGVRHKGLLLPGQALLLERRLPVHIPLPLPGIYKGTPHPVALRVPSQEESFGEKKSASLKLLVLHGNVPHCADREQIHIPPMDTEEPERANQANECPR